MTCQYALTGNISFIMFFELYLQYVASNTKLVMYTLCICLYSLQLQEAFAKGLVKPGLNIVSTDHEKHYKNDVVSRKGKW
jgi:hypothetical protein